MTLTPETLETLRAQLDDIDRELLEKLRDRIECCTRIAEVKADHGVPMMAPHRIGIVQERAAEFGARNGIDGRFLRDLYDLVITETCRVEDIVIAARSHPCTPC